MSKTYRLVRLFESGEFRTIRRGLTLSQAQRHCDSPETDSDTATGNFSRAFTRRFGRWVDGFQKEA